MVAKPVTMVGGIDDDGVFGQTKVAQCDAERIGIANTLELPDTTGERSAVA